MAEGDLKNVVQRPRPFFFWPVMTTLTLDGCCRAHITVSAVELCPDCARIAATVFAHILPCRPRTNVDMVVSRCVKVPRGQLRCDMGRLVELAFLPASLAMKAANMA